MLSMWGMMVMMLLLFLLLLLHNVAISEALPANLTGTMGTKLPMLPPAQHKQPSFNPDDISLYVTMFLNLMKGIGDWRNVIAADTIQSVWQSPPMVDMSSRIFGK